MPKDKYLSCFKYRNCLKCQHKPRAVSILDRGKVMSVMVGCRDARHITTFKRVIKRLEV